MRCPSGSLRNLGNGMNLCYTLTVCTGSTLHRFANSNQGDRRRVTRKPRRAEHRSVQILPKVHSNETLDPTTTSNHRPEKTHEPQQLHQKARCLDHVRWTCRARVGLPRRRKGRVGARGSVSSWTLACSRGRARRGCRVAVAMRENVREIVAVRGVWNDFCVTTSGTPGVSIRPVRVSMTGPVCTRFRVVPLPRKWKTPGADTSIGRFR